MRVMVGMNTFTYYLLIVFRIRELIYFKENMCDASLVVHVMNCVLCDTLPITL